MTTSIMWQKLINEKSKPIAARLLAFLGAILVWQIAAWAVGHDVLLSSPLDVGVRLIHLAGERNTYLVLLNSMGRTLLGFALGLVVGCLLAVPAARLPLVETALFPYMVTIRSVPVASFIVLAYVWLSSAELSVFISFLIVLPVIYNSLLGALKARDRGLDEMATVFHLPFFTRLRYVWVPQIRAALLAACATSVGLAWKSGVAAELIGLCDRTIGGELYNAKLYLDTPALFAWTLIIVLASVVTEKAILALLRLILTGGRQRA